MTVNLERSYPHVNTKFWNQFEEDMKVIKSDEVFQYFFDNKNFELSVQNGIKDKKFTLTLTLNKYDQDLENSIKKKAFEIIEGMHGFILQKNFKTNYNCEIVMAGDLII
jgi:hypothetical protein